MIPGENRILGFLEESEIECVIATSPANVYFTSGMESVVQQILGENCFSIWTADGGPYLVVPFVDISNIIDCDVLPKGVYAYFTGDMGEIQYFKEAEYSGKFNDLLNEVKTFDESMEALVHLMKSLTEKGDTIGLEQHGVSSAEKSTLENALTGSAVRPVDKQLRGIRGRKNQQEIVWLKQAAEINEHAIDHAVSQIESGMTETEIANIFAEYVTRNGAKPIVTLVGFGEHSAFPHVRPGGTEIQEGDLIRFDVVIEFENYYSDIARTFSFQSSKDAHSTKYRTLFEGMEAAINALSPGSTTTEVFDTGIDWIQEHGSNDLQNYQRHHIGHGIGLSAYDAPLIAESGEPISPGMVFCVETPFYKLGSGGIQVEDEVVVTETGVDRLTAAPSTLPVIE